jgi:hypothetical protein
MEQKELAQLVGGLFLPTIPLASPLELLKKLASDSQFEVCELSNQKGLRSFEDPSPWLESDFPSQIIDAQLQKTQIDVTVRAKVQKSSNEITLNLDAMIRIAPLVNRLGIYPLRSSGVTSFVEEEKDGQIQCYFSKFGFLPVGSGPTVAEAKRSICRKIHFTFQRLVIREYFERSEDDQRTWDELEQVIDLDRYESYRHVLKREVGQLVKLPNDAGISEERSGDENWRVKWYISDKEESLSIDQVPVDFARLRPGQWFDALVEREPNTSLLRRIIHTQVRRAPAQLDDKELQRHITERRYPGQLVEDPQ